MFIYSFCTAFGCITSIVNEDRAISADTALRLSRYLDTSATVWTGLQADYDLEIAAAANYAALKRITTLPRDQSVT